MRARRTLTAATAALALALAACEPIDDGTGGGGLFPDTTADVSVPDVRVDTSGVAFPPAIIGDSDTQQANAEAAVLSFFGGEIVIELQAGSLDADTTIVMTRSVIRADEKDWVGYTFGDHGIPLDPRGSLTMLAPVEWVPPGAATDPTLGLYRVDGLRLGDKLETASSSVTGDRYTITVALDALDTFVLATK
jgi:hypothetical protein